MRSPVLYFFSALLIAACSRPHLQVNNGCKATFLGYSVPTDTTFLLTPKCVFGKINAATGNTASIATIRNTLQSNQGAFNTRDYCYYTLRVPNDTGQPLLYKISLDGKVAEIKGPNENRKLEGLVYCPQSGKLCAFGRKLGTSDISLCEIGLTGDGFVVKEVVRAIPYASPASYIWSCVNRNTDEIFFTLSTGNASRIYKLDTGAKRAVLVYDSPDATLLGLCVNEDDGMLFCVEQDTVKSSLLKITTQGRSELVASLPHPITESCVSTGLGSCNKEYIVSGKSSGVYGHFLVVTLSDGVVRKFSTSYVLLGLVALD